jgi:pyroglutamyl-peptidase
MRSRAISPVRVLVTGFGPFPGVLSNASQLVIEGLRESRSLPGIRLFSEVIPVIWANARAVAQQAIGGTNPHAILHFGVSKRSTGFEIETRAVNMSGPKEDYARITQPIEPLDRSGKMFLHATLPAPALLLALRQSGFPAQLSKDAGRYLCNALLYWSLAEAGQSGPLVSFIHMPALGTDTKVKPGLTLAESILGARVLIRASAQAVLRARQNGNGKGDGVDVFHRSNGHRSVWQGRP